VLGVGQAACVPLRGDGREEFGCTALATVTLVEFLPLTPHIVIIVTLTRHSLVAGPEHRQHVNWIRLIFLSDRLQRLSFALDFSNVQITLLSFLLLRVDPVNGSIVIRLRKLLDELVGTILLLNELNHSWQ